MDGWMEGEKKKKAAGRHSPHEGQLLLCAAVLIMVGQSQDRRPPLGEPASSFLHSHPVWKL